MEKLVNPYDKEYMKLAMLKHEEVFREQVFELHRLYQIQKMLMKNIRRSGQKSLEESTWNFKKCEKKIEGLDMEMPAEEDGNNKMGIECDGIGKMVDESELLELTLGPSRNFYRRRKVAVNSPLLLLQSDNHSGTSLSSSSSSNNNRQQHHQQKTSRQENNSQKWRVDNHVPIKSNHHSFRGETKNGLNNVAGEEGLRQDRSLNSNPPWLFQALSLKMT